MKSFHKTMGYLSGIFIIMIISSLAVSSSYMTRNNIKFRDLFDGTTRLNFDENFDFQLDSLFNNLEKASHFDTKIIEKSDSFESVKELFISSSIEEISFIEEDRKDIKVDYFRELPNSKYYTVTYSASASNDKLTISAATAIKNLTINRDYKGSITVHVPNGYAFNKITLDSGISKLKTENIYPNTKNLTIISSLGDVDLDINNSLDSLSITSNLGSVKLKVEAAIKKLYVNCDLGKIDLSLNASVDDLSIEENLGDIFLTSESTLGVIKVKNNMGKIEGNFNGTIDGADFVNNMGNINITLADNDNISIYVETNLGSVDSDYPKTDKKSTDFKFTSNMGSIHVKNSN